MKLNQQPAFLKVGDKVTTEYHQGAEEVVRKIIAIEEAPSYGSGYVASVDGGERCTLCKRIPASGISGVDAAWFVPVEEKQRRK